MSIRAPVRLTLIPLSAEIPSSLDVPAHRTRRWNANRRSLINYDSLKPSLFREVLEPIPAAVAETSPRNKVDCAGSYNVDVKNDEADRPGR